MYPQSSPKKYIYIPSSIPIEVVLADHPTGMYPIDTSSSLSILSQSDRIHLLAITGDMYVDTARQKDDLSHITPLPPTTITTSKQP